jgi:hypothetical protein
LPQQLGKNHTDQEAAKQERERSRLNESSRLLRNGAKVPIQQICKADEQEKHGRLPRISKKVTSQEGVHLARREYQRQNREAAEQFGSVFPSLGSRIEEHCSQHQATELHPLHHATFFEQDACMPFPCPPYKCFQHSSRDGKI